MVSLPRKEKGLFAASILVQCRGGYVFSRSISVYSQGKAGHFSTGLSHRHSHGHPSDPRGKTRRAGPWTRMESWPRRFHGGRPHTRASETPCKGRHSPGGIDHWIIVVPDVNSPSSYGGSQPQGNLCNGITPRNSTSLKVVAETPASNQTNRRGVIMRHSPPEGAQTPWPRDATAEPALGIGALGETPRSGHDVVWGGTNTGREAEPALLLLR